MNFSLLAAAAMLALSVTSHAESAYSHLYDGLQFEMPVIDRPVFADRSVSLVDFGGVGDGVTLNSDAFSKAIESLSSQGGGTLVVPAGVWLTGPIELKSNINLHLDRGAILTFSGDDTLYKMVYVVYEGFEAWRAQSPISGRDLENVAITGEGVIDGNGSVWRPVRKGQLTKDEWNNYLSKGALSTATLGIPRRAISTASPCTRSVPS